MIISINMKPKSEGDIYKSEIRDPFCVLAWAHANALEYGLIAEYIIPVGISIWGGNAVLLRLVDDPSPYLVDCPLVLPETGRVRAVVALAGVFNYSEYELPFLLVHWTGDTAVATHQSVNPLVAYMVKGVGE
jgi:hypothetical protein